MPRRTRTLLLAGLLAGSAALARAQDTKADASPEAAHREQTALEKSVMAAFIGDWKGTGVYQTGPGKSETVQVTEKAHWRFDGKAILVEGMGTVTEADGSTRTAHDAIAIIRMDEKTGKIMFHAFKPDQEPIVTEMVVLEDGRMQWGFDPAPSQRVRFTIEFGENTWKESGEFSPDGGKTWYPFFEMELERVEEGQAVLATPLSHLPEARILSLRLVCT